MIGDAIALAFWWTIVFCVVGTALVTAGLIYGIPVLWTWIKPWLHLVTA